MSASRDTGAASPVAVAPPAPGLPTDLIGTLDMPPGLLLFRRWRERLGRWPAAVALGVLISAVACTVSPYRDFQLATMASVVIMIAGLSVLVGSAGRISFGQGALAAVGAYAQAVLTTRLGVPALAAVAAAVAAATVLGVALGLLTARLTGYSFSVFTLVLAVAVPSLPAGLPPSVGGSAGLATMTFAAPPVAAVAGSTERWAAVVCCLLAVAGLTVVANLLDSSVGRSWRAVRDDPAAAELAGESIRRARTSAFALSAACAGLGGALLATVIGVASPDGFPLSLSLTLLAAVVLGGVANLSGAVAGAVLVVFLPGLTAGITGPMHLSVAARANVPLAIYGLALIVVVRVAPAGLVPLARQLLQAGGHRRPRQPA